LTDTKFRQKVGAHYSKLWTTTFYDITEPYQTILTCKLYNIELNPSCRRQPKAIIY